MKVRGHSSVTLLFPSQQVLSTRVGEDEEGSRVLAWAQAAVSREPVTPLRQLGAARCTRRASGSSCRAGCGLWQEFYGCGGAGLLVAVCGKRSRLLFFFFFF